MTDAAGTTAQAYLYDSFGNNQSTDSLENPYTFTGREFDPESGLYYYRARYYDSNNGRFLTEDPIGFNGLDINLYRYVRNNPVKFTDPVGLLNFLAGVGGSGAFGVGVEASAGAVINYETGDASQFFSVGAGIGLNVSADAFLGFTFGGLEDLAGVTNNINLVAGPFSLTVIFDDGGFPSFRGFTLGVGPFIQSLPLLQASIVESLTLVGDPQENLK